MGQNIDVHSTDELGTNIHPGRDDGNGGVGNGSTYQLYRNDADTNSGNQIYYAKDKDGNVEPIAPGGGGLAPSYQATATDDITTSSVTDVVATGMTLTPLAGTYLVWFSGSTQITNDDGAVNATSFVSIYSDGTQIPSSEQKINDGATSSVVSLPCFPFNCVAKVIVNGSQTIEGRWRTSDSFNTATMHQRNLTILKTT